MASPGGGASASSSTAQAQAAMDDERRRQRRSSNRESARRARARKQMQVDNLEAETEALRGKKSRLDAAVRATQRGYAAVEAENAVLRAQALELRAQALELGARLRSLIELLQYSVMDSFSLAASGCSGAQILQQQPPAFTDPADDGV